MYIAKEEQSRKVLHSHSIVLIDDSECLDAGNSYKYDPYASSNECSSESSSECSYNHKSKNK